MTTKALKSGVYTITHLPSGKRYIGSSLDVRQRLATHKWALKRGSHANPFLQNSYNKYGKDEFSFQKILVCAPADVIFYEQKIMDGYKSYNKEFGYNIRIKAESNAGCKMPESWILKQKGRISPMKGIKKDYPAWNKGKHGYLSEEARDGIKRSNEKRRGIPTRRIVSQATRDKLSSSLQGREVWNKGIAMSDETKKKLSESKKEKNKSPEVRERYRQAKLNAKKPKKYSSGNAVKTHCKYGHPLNGENLYKHPNANRRGCKTCIRENSRKRKVGVSLP